MLDGYSPWVTGADHASTIVTGAVLDDGRQILVALPTDLPGVTIPPPPRLVGLSASHTGEVHLADVRVGREWLLAGPAENVMKIGVGAGTGGLQTSTLAIALASAAIDYLDAEVDKRPDLAGPAAELRREHDRLASHALGVGRRRAGVHERGAARRGQQHRAARHASGAGRGQGLRLRRRPSGRPLVPRGAVLPGLELPARRHGRQPLRAGRFGVRTQLVVRGWWLVNREAEFTWSPATSPTRISGRDRHSCRRSTMRCIHT